MTTLAAELRPGHLRNPPISTTNNRFDSGPGYSYDSSGNATADAEGRTFVYDAENKQVEVIESSVTIGEYFYDGDGKRVKKIVPGGETTVFVYDAGGKLIGEYSTIVQTGGNAKTVYTTDDHLGSPRINTDGVGTVISRHDYHPFGEEIARTGYGSDTIRKQFTGYERDGETNLDYAKARMFGSSLGRFTSPDPALSSGREVIPQSWNRYAYSLNNPLRFVDPLGLYEFDASVDSKQQQNFRDSLEQARKNLKEIRKLYGKNSEEYKEAKKGVESYGCEVGTKGCNEKAGTGVLVATTKNFTNGETGTAERIENGKRVMVTLDSKKLSQANSSEIIAAIAHEGVHVQDHLNYINSGGSTKVTNYDTERRAYVVTSAIMHVRTDGYTMMMNNTHYSLFKSQWVGANNKITKQGESARNAEIDKLLAVPTSQGELYGVSPQAPNPPNKIDHYFP